MISLPVLNKKEEELALAMLTTECRKVKSCPLDNPLYKVAIAALTHATDLPQCPLSKDCEKVEVEDWKEVCKPKPDPESISNLVSFLGGAVGSLTYRLMESSREPLKSLGADERMGALAGRVSKINPGPTHKPPTMESEQPNTWKELSRKLTQDCHNPTSVCPMRSLSRCRIYEEHGLNLRKRCPFFVLDCDSVTETMWETELLLAEVKREAMKK